MPELIQFECPSCAATLRVPLEMAGLRGPCPLCHRDIIAPNPYTGIGTHFPPHQPAPELAPVHDFDGFADPEPESAPEPAVESPPQESDLPPVGIPAEAPEEIPVEIPQPPASPGKNHPFADKLIDSPPAPEIPQEPQPEPPPAADERIPEPEAPAPAAKSGRAGRVAAILLGLILALVAGFFIGNHFRPLNPEAPPVVPPAKAPEEPVPPVTPAPTVDPAEHSPVPDPPPKPPEEYKTSLEKAKASLKAFLEAPDWTTRSAYVLSPDIVRPKMEAYAKNNDDGPTVFTSITIPHSQIDADTETMFLIFKVVSANVPEGFPVAVLETSKGWFVDWELFVEFRDDLFKEFTEGPPDHVGEFHVYVTAPEEGSGSHIENDTYATFVVAPPIPGRQKSVFVKKSNAAYPRLKEATETGRTFAPVLKITKATTKDGRSYLEILSIEANDWRPRGVMPSP